MVHDASLSPSAAELMASAKCGAPAEAIPKYENGIEYAEAVFAVGALIPRGKVLSYGDIAELLGSGGPRQVGAAMAGSADHVCWWRVIRANGTLRDDLQARALVQWEAEDTVVRNGKVLMAQARWQPDEEAHQRIDAISAALPIVPLAKRHSRLI